MNKYENSSWQEIKVIVADDEKTTRDGLALLIKWKELCVTDVKYASDGKEALEIANEMIPDIIISDIKMPKLSGIDFSYNIKKLYPNCKIIFISGHSDKEYLKSAIDLQVVRYIEKPIDLAELHKAIKDTVELIKNERILKKSADQQFLLDDATLQLIDDNVDILTVINKLHTLFPIFLQGNCYCDVIIQSTINNETINDAFAKYFKSFLTCRIMSNSYLLHLCFKDNDFTLPIKKIYEQILEDLQKQSLNVSIAVGRTVDDILDIRESYSTAKEALSLFYWQGYGSILYFKYMQYEKLDIENFDLGIYINVESKKNAQEKLNKLSNFILRKNFAVIEVKEFYAQLALSLSNHFAEYGYGKLLSAHDIEINVMNSTHFLTLANWISDKAYEYFNLCENLTIERPAFATLKFIHDNYTDSTLTVIKISQKINVTISHICHVFKKETGQTVNEYINMYRIDKSKNLLDNSEMKLAEIAKAVGYSDANYYTRLFKKICGSTPSEYRNRFHTRKEE